jgi:hypothetical protein
LLKWKLMLTTLPFVVVITGLKAFLEYGVQFSGVVEFSDVGVVLTGAVFLTGFLLAGTMSDYKESEKLPGEVATHLEAIEDMYGLAVHQKPGVDGKVVRKQLLTLTDAIKGWLVKKQTTAEVFAALTTMTEESAAYLVQHNAGSTAGYALSSLDKLRKTISRIDVISRTGFLPPAYALLEVLLAMVLTLMMFAKFKNSVAEFVIVPTVALLNVYMLRLIKDIDDPFDFGPDGAKRGGAEVDLFPLDEFRARLAARIGS